jgi:hypothetical protein
MEEWKKEQLKQLLNKNFALRLDAKIFAPVIHIPQNALSDDTVIIICDLGLLRILSKERPDETDAEFYDYFDVSVSDINLRLSTPVTTTCPLSNFNVNLSVAKCKFPLDPHMAMFRIKGWASDIIGEIHMEEIAILKGFQDMDYSYISVSSAVSESGAGTSEFKAPALVSSLSDDDEEFFDVMSNDDIPLFEEELKVAKKPKIVFPPTKQHL